MVGGGKKVKAAAAMQKSPSSSSSSSSKKGSTTRSFGVYFPRVSSQVQPKPPDRHNHNVPDLLRTIEQLREREYLLKTQLLEQKLFKESAAVLPLLENEITKKDAVILKLREAIAILEMQNGALRRELEERKSEAEEQKKETEKKINELSKTVSYLEEANKELTLTVSSSSSSHTNRLPFQFHSCSNRSVKKEVKTTTFVSTEKKEAVEEKVLFTENEISSSAPSSLVRTRETRVPKPPPKPSLEDRVLKEINIPPARAAPPPPPPPPFRAKGGTPGAATVRKVPEVVEFYHSLMRRESRKEVGGGGGGACAGEVPATANARDMIGEIENRSAHLLAIKTDVETQGDFIKSLIKEVENAAFSRIEDVVPFVKWLDDELSYLVDERAVLKHFNWPEQKADALREAAFGYSDLKKLETEASSFQDDARLSCASAIKKMQALFEKLEHGVYNLSRMRELTSNRYKSCQIPVDWMLETGCVSQIKVASVKLAMKYMKRVSAELENVDSIAEEEELIIQGVRFAFRVHQFAGGFDVETMKAFQELREKARACHVQRHNQQQKSVCR